MSMSRTLLLLLLMPAFGLPVAQVMAQEAGCSYTNTRVRNNQLLICSSEGMEGFEVPRTPPSASVLRLALDKAVRPQISSVRPQPWPIRAMLWIGPEIAVEIWAEFDRQGNLVRSNFAVPGTHMVEYQRNGSPVWMGGQRVYSMVDPQTPVTSDSITVTRKSLVLADGRACPVQRVDEGYLDYVQGSEMIFLSGNCPNAVQRRIGAGDFWVYPESFDITFGAPDFTRFYWAVQYFQDDIAPLIKADGTCVLYCDAPPRKHSGAYKPLPHVPASPALDLSPPPANALKGLKGEILEHPLDQIPPATWPVRALFNSRAGIFEFDRQGYLLSPEGRSNVRAVKVRYGRMRGPMPRAVRQHVYWLIGASSVSSIAEASVIDSGIVLAGERACPVQRVAEAFSILHGRGGYGYLNGNCAKAVKRRLGAGEFWVYPEDRKTEHPQYWVVQYFDQPATPIVDAQGHCWLYCDYAADVESRQE